MSAESSLRRAGGVGSGALGRQPDSLADVLERVLDKGIVIAGDIVVNILDIELLTLKLRLFISSAETAQQMGMDWWTQDPFFSGRAAVAADAEEETRALRERVAELEQLVQQAGLTGDSDGRPRAVDGDGDGRPRAVDGDGGRS